MPVASLVRDHFIRGVAQGESELRLVRRRGSPREVGAVGLSTIDRGGRSYFLRYLDAVNAPWFCPSNHITAWLAATRRPTV